MITCGTYDGCDREIFFLRAALIPRDLVCKTRFMEGALKSMSANTADA